MLPFIAFFTFVILIALIWWLYTKSLKSTWKIPDVDFPKHWRKVLIENVAFYNALNKNEKELFENKILEFVYNIKITPVKTDVDEIDKVLIAASGIIPIFSFPDWKHYQLKEVLLYPKSFDHDFETEGKGKSILGMVGTGYMNGKMILSKRSLRHGFKSETDSDNTAIHEFIHLLDKKDGRIDGLPQLFVDNSFAIPWFDLMDKKITEIEAGKSDIQEYATTNRAEFFSVLGEYFFEKPRMLAKKHPELYDMLEQVFKQDMVTRSLHMKRITIGRNSKCFCQSGKKYKLCCGAITEI